MPAQAAWELVDGAGSPRANASVYIDRGSIERVESTRRIRQLYDMHSTAPSGMRSWVSLEEYDCHSKQLRLMEAVAFAAPMARGEPLGTMSLPIPWMPVSPGTSAERVFRIVCP